MLALFHTTDAEGETLVAPTLAQMRTVLASLEDADEADFPDVSLIHANGWAVTVDLHWNAVLERADDEAPLRVLKLKGLPEALELWRTLARGDVETLLGLPWKDLAEE